MRFFYRIFFWTCLLVCSDDALGQAANRSNDTLVSASKQYDRANLFRWMWGHNRRQEWTTAVQVPLFWLENVRGGMKVYEASSGGNETQSLRLRSPDNREYVLRSIDKSRDEVIPTAFKGSFVEKIIQDGVSMSHPYGAFALAGMQEAAGILHTLPQLVYLPEQPALDSFNQQFSNKLYLFEERPDEDWSTAPHMGGFSNYSGTEKVMENLLEDSRNHANQYAYAKVRLFDMMVGDWDRHADNFRWGKADHNGAVKYEPVPRDRDQVFYTHDGWLINSLIKLGGYGFMSHLDKEIKNVTTVPAQQKDADMFFTNSLSLQEWVRAASELQVSLTDSIIRESLRGMPAEIYDINGEKLLEILVERKTQLISVAEKYYRFLAKQVIVAGSKQNELFSISEPASGQLTLTITPLETDSGQTLSPVYSRSFAAAETKSITIYGIDGADKYRVESNTTGITLKIIAGPGTDSVIANNAGSLVVVDSGSTAITNINTRLRLLVPDSSPVFHFRQQQPKQLGFGITPHLYYDADPLFKRSLGISLNGYRLLGNNKWRATATAWFTPVKWINFFGIGNETMAPDSNRSFNRFKATEWGGSLGLRANWKNTELKMEGLYLRSASRQDEDGYLSKNLASDTVFAAFQYAGPRLVVTTGKQNDQVLPTSGWLLNAEAGVFRNLKLQHYFGSYRLNARAYIPLSPKFSFALKGGSTIISGGEPDRLHAQWFQHAIIGGPETLRGYRWNRFWGSSAVYNQNELRYLTDIRSYLLNARVGAFLFTDNGRVWQQGERSDKWHNSYGAGLLLAPFGKIHCSFTWAMSGEENPLQFVIQTKL